MAWEYVYLLLAVAVLWWMYTSLRAIFQFLVLLIIAHYYIFYWALPEYTRWQAGLPPPEIPPSLFQSLVSFVRTTINSTKEL